MAVLIFQPDPSNFGQVWIFYRQTNDEIQLRLIFTGIEMGQLMPILPSTNRLWPDETKISLCEHYAQVLQHS